MDRSVKTNLSWLLTVCLCGWLGLSNGCGGTGGSFCETAEPPTPAATALGAVYTNVTTTVGTPLTVAPAYSGGPVTSATLNSGTLPPGMVLNADGSITGTPTQAGVFPLLVSLCSRGTCILRPVVVTVNAPSAAPLNADYNDAATLVGSALSVPPIQVSGGPVTGATLVQGSLPAGMTLDPSTGVISGIPTTPGVYQVTIALSNASGGAVAVPVTITVSAAGATAIAATYVDAAGPVGTPLTVSPTVTSGGPIVAATLASGIIPPGMTLNSDGSISGTPTVPGTYTAQVTLRNASGAQTTQTVTLTITHAGATPIVAGYVDATGMVGSPLTVDPSLTSGGPLTGATLISGSVPPGMTLVTSGPNAGGIAGTPTLPGLYTLEIQLCNGTGACTIEPVNIMVSPAVLGLTYSDQTFPQGVVIATQSPTLANPVPGLPTTYALTGGNPLPVGLNLDPSTGAITGTPSVPGVYTFTVTATNGGQTATTSPTFTVTPSAALTVHFSDQTFTQGAAIAMQSPVLTNPTPGLATTYALTGGNPLPPGLSLNTSTGAITGIPVTPGVYPFTITATNGSRTATTTQTYTVLPAAGLALGYTNQTFPAGAAIATQSPVLTNPTPGIPTTYALTGANPLPPGLSLDTNTGAITGIPSTAGVYPFTITATNGSRTAGASPTFTVTPSALLSVGYSDQIFTQSTLIAVQSPVLANQTPGLATTYALTGANPLPPGLSLDAGTGLINGTPTTAGVYTFTITATNGTRTATTTPTYTVVPSAALGVSFSNQGFTQGTPIATQTPVLTNPTPGIPTTYALTGGNPLPPGLTLDPNSGAITGTPLTPGVYTFTITATNGTRSAISSPTYTVVPSASLGVSYVDRTFPQGAVIATQSPTLTDPTPGVPTTYALTGASPLPLGLSLDTSSGAITGAPSTPGIYTFTVTATNGSRTATTTPTFTVTPSTPLGLGYSSKTFLEGMAIPAQVPGLTNPTPGVATTYALTGANPLPLGLSLNPATGAITGTPTVPGTYPFTVTATNGTTNGITPRTAAASATYTILPAGSLSLEYATPQTFTQNTPVAAQSPVLANGTPGVPTTYGVTAGSLPAGLVINAASGTITGTPTAVGDSTFTVAATNGARTATATAVYHVLPAGTMSLGYATPQVFPAGASIAVQNPTLANATAPATYAVTAGSLPGGLSLNPSTGSISGLPTTPGVYRFTITATDSAAHTASASSIYTITPAAALTENYASGTFTAGVAIPSQAPTITNETPGVPTQYAVTSGSLPPGLTLDPATGIIDGNPTTPGVYTFTVTAQNGTRSTTASPTFTVLSFPTANLAGNPSTVPVHQSSSLTILFTGSADGTAVLSGGNLATPLTVTSGTSLPTGVVDSPAAYIYTLTVTNAVGAVATTQATIAWIPAPADIWTVNIPPGGGTYVPGAGNLLNGQISITVPDQGQSTCGAVTLTVNKEASLPGALSSGVQNASTTFNIASSVGYPFRVPITVTLTYDPTLTAPDLGNADVPMAFFWDPSYQKWVSTGLKGINTGTHQVSFTTLLPGRYAVLAIPGLASALSSQAPGSPAFATGTDNWKQDNLDIYDQPNGATLGMGSFASWFYGMRKTTVGLYDLFPTAGDVNARALVSRLANGTADDWNQLWRQAGYSLSNTQTGLALITGLMVTGQPQLFLMGDSRPAVNNSLTTVVYKYDDALGKFSLMDPNYPSNTLTIAWNDLTGVFSAYDRAAGYSPSLAQFAFEGQTSVHRLADYERVLDGATRGWTNPPFASINVTRVGSDTSPDLSSPLVISSSTNVLVTGSVVNGSDAAGQLFWSQNGSAPRQPIAVNPDGSFSFTIPALANPYATTIMLETTSNPCDPTFSHSGFREFKVMQASLVPWFQDACFESAVEDRLVSSPAYGAVGAWTHEVVNASASLASYPVNNTTGAFTGSFNASGNVNSYVTWVPGFLTPDEGAAGGLLLDNPSPAIDAKAHLSPGGSDTYLPRVLSGSKSFQLNDTHNRNNDGQSPSQARTHRSLERLIQTITVPSDVTRPQLSFSWAAVLQAGTGHTPSDRPYVDVIIQDMGTGTTPTWTNTGDLVNYGNIYYHHFYANEPQFTGWLPSTYSATEWVSIPWQKMNLNLSAYKGHKVRVVIATADCVQTGHACYAYVDSLTCE